MPYIPQSERFEVMEDGPKTAGQLNYAISTLVNEYLKQETGLNYQRINDVLGALEGAKLEFYRRIVESYENTKLSTNGDVYGK